MNAKRTILYARSRGLFALILRHFFLLRFLLFLGLMLRVQYHSVSGRLRNKDAPVDEKRRVCLSSRCNSSLVFFFPVNSSLKLLACFLPASRLFVFPSATHKRVSEKKLGLGIAFQTTSRHLMIPSETNKTRRAPFSRLSENIARIRFRTSGHERTKTNAREA